MDEFESVKEILYQIPAHPHGADVVLAGQVVHFYSDSAEGMRIIQAIIGPYCTVSEVSELTDHGNDWTVTAISGAANPAANALREMTRNEQPSCQVKRWAGDDAADRYDLDSGTCVIAHQQPFEGLTVFSRQARRITYVRWADPLNIPHTEHCVKYPLRSMMRFSGFAQAHASSFSYQSRGVLVTGEKGRGKSTLLIQAMTNGAKQVGNDMGYVRALAGGGCEMIAFPHMTRLAAGTIGDSERLRDLLSRPRDGGYLNAPVFNGGKEEFYYPVLERLWGPEPVCHKSGLDLIIFPMLDVRRDRSTAVPVDRETAHARLRSSLLNDPPLPEWLPFFAPDELNDLIAAATEPFLRNAPEAYELHFGPAATDPVHTIEELLKK